MTKNEKNEVAVLRRQGLGYKKIASKLDIPLSTVKSHCLRNNLSTGDGDLCIQCGMPLKGKATKFCSIKCKNCYWNNKPRYEKVCKNCEKLFISNMPKQIFCSHECYIKNRFNGMFDDENEQNI